MWPSDGGGINVGFGSSALIKGNTIYKNFSDSGGGIMCLGSATVLHNRLVENIASSVGGGIYLYTTAKIDGNVIAFNRVLSGVGGGIGIDYEDPILTNNIIFKNSANAGGGIYRDLIIIGHMNFSREIIMAPPWIQYNSFNLQILEKGDSNTSVGKKSLDDFTH